MFFKKNQMGVIYDSAPGLPGNLFDFINAILELSGIKFTPLRIMTVSFLTVYFKGYFFLTNYFLSFLETVMKVQAPPSLYMYSKADKLISAENISKFIEDKKKLFPGAYSKSVVYEEAAHTQIYRMYPEDYLKNVREHLIVCKCDLESILNDEEDRSANELIRSKL